MLTKSETSTAGLQPALGLAHFGILLVIWIKLYSYIHKEFEYSKHGLNIVIFSNTE